MKSVWSEVRGEIGWLERPYWIPANWGLPCPIESAFEIALTMPSSWLKAREDITSLPSIPKHTFTVHVRSSHALLLIVNVGKFAFVCWSSANMRKKIVGNLMWVISEGWNSSLVPPWKLEIDTRMFLSIQRLELCEERSSMSYIHIQEAISKSCGQVKCRTNRRVLRLYRSTSKCSATVFAQYVKKWLLAISSADKMDKLLSFMLHVHYPSKLLHFHLC